MRKSTKNKVIHGILIIFVIIIALLASLVAAFRDVTLQTMVARSIAGELSKKLQTDVKIRTFYITYNLGICIEGVQINDVYGYPMFKVGKLYAKMIPTLDLSDIRLKDLYMEDVLGNVVKYDGFDRVNVTERFSLLGGGTDKQQIGDEEPAPFHFKVDNMRLDNGRVIYWNQLRDDPDKLSMDYHHIDIDSIYGIISDFEIRQDSIMWNVHNLKGKDRCGLVLDDAHGDVLFCEKCLNIDNLMLATGVSQVDLDMRFEYNRSSDYDYFEDSVRIIGNIRESTIKLSDLKYFSWVLGKMPDTFVFTAFFDGYVREFTVRDLDADFGRSSHIDADVSFKGVEEFDNSYIDINIRSLASNYEDVRDFAIPIEGGTVPLPEMFENMGAFELSGTFQGYPEDFNTRLRLLTGYGDIDAYAYLNTTDNSQYTFDVLAKDLNIKELLDLEDESKATFTLNLEGRGLEVDETNLIADLDVESLKIMGNEFNEFNVHGDFGNSCLVANMALYQPLVKMNLSSVIDLNDEKPHYKIAANIKEADLVKLHLLDFDTIMNVAADVNLDFSGHNLDNLKGSADIRNLRYFNGDTYTMEKFVATVDEVSGIKDITIDCDFFDFTGSGIVSASTFKEAFRNSARRYIHLPAWYDDEMQPTDKQEFSISMNLKDTRQLSKLFMPELYISDGTTINATYTSEYPYHNSAIEASEVIYNDLIFNNLYIRNTARYNEYQSNVTLDDIIIRDTSAQYTERISLENVRLLGKCSNDTIKFDLTWDDNAVKDHNKAHFTSTFVPHSTSGGLLSVNSDEILVNDTVWTLHPDCKIDFQKDRIGVDHLMLYTGTQSMALNGYVPQRNNDTLIAVLNNVNVSDFDFITLGNDINFDGTANGIVGVSGVNENLAFFSNLELTQFYLNDQEVGDVYVNTLWHDPDKSIYINTELYNSMFGDERHEAVGLVGYYYPLRASNNLKFDLDFDDFKLETVSPFISNVVKRMSGHASGNVKIRGSLKEPEIIGRVAMNQAGCLVNYLNTYFTFSDTITMLKDKIVFNDILVHDTTGHAATLSGAINHTHLRDYDFDIKIKCKDFLALNIPAENAEGFYGTAIADGVVSIKGPINDIAMNIDAVTKKGTEIDVPLSGASSMNDNFIVFVKNNEIADTITERYVPELVKDEGKYTININTEVNPDAEVNIYLPMNMGSINARGSGNLSLGVTNDDFTLRGDYLMHSGTFNFSLEMVKRTFTLRDGGTIRWTGDPTDADINLVGVYRTKSSLTSLGTTAVDTTALTNNVNVDCIIRLTDKLMNPTITFGIELPNVKDDTRNLVYSIIDTTNQGVMAQQVFSLMMLGSFAYAAESNVARIGTTTGYGVITSQLSNWLSQISKDFDIGINYTPNDRLTNEELEVALSTQLFDDRLVIEGNFGVIRGDKNSTNNANNIVGDVDISFKLTKRLSLKAYNHTNIRNNYYIYSFENYSDFTQGVGISFSQSFDNVKEIFNYNKKNKKR